ncbi:hypothetical protein D5086_032331 [Populus alba]|uniref:Uncharacterized protein n=1 Tax=Populus alba TaxID=43335 RepID=A0ACC4ALT9_POPAL
MHSEGKGIQTSDLIAQQENSQLSVDLSLHFSTWDAGKGRYHSPSPSYTADDSSIQRIGSLFSASASDTTNDN